MCCEWETIFFSAQNENIVKTENWFIKMVPVWAVEPTTMILCKYKSLDRRSKQPLALLVCLWAVQTLLHRSKQSAARESALYKKGKLEWLNSATFFILWKNVFSWPVLKKDFSKQIWRCFYVVQVWIDQGWIEHCERSSRSLGCKNYIVRSVHEYKISNAFART